jgi:hypothetical protein
VYSKMGSSQTIGFASMTDDVASQKDWRAGFASVTTWSN